MEKFLNKIRTNIPDPNYTILPKEKGRSTGIIY